MKTFQIEMSKESETGGSIMKRLLQELLAANSSTTHLESGSKAAMIIGLKSYCDLIGKKFSQAVSDTQKDVFNQFKKEYKGAKQSRRSRNQPVNNKDVLHIINCTLLHYHDKLPTHIVESILRMILTQTAGGARAGEVHFMAAGGFKLILHVDKETGKQTWASLLPICFKKGVGFGLHPKNVMEGMTIE
jgi:hypothetical protein